MTKLSGACALMPSPTAFLEVDAQQIVAAHPGLARHSGGDDADVRSSDVGIILGSGKDGVEALDGPRLGEVERLALRDALGDVDEDDVAHFADRREVGQCAADHSGADERDLRASHRGCSSLS
jgi:hypothetical protein